ncbi:MAG: bifunctional (p)ppGpp synthetase/guanosine-3',5'-bis(diphosphate) 3'-pyrophosphohydrolase [Cryomorphaceae bacterium]|nr:bifunctional (p)ppGpp synthetase/guanosine-3',5'-bis(diphosphate) 3'-pyrophosphohydrolase [Cryomorphaceae bacterium]MBT4237234.1 bifunctional (p)ppGpp synthetase/guanosine-3',5'-bis(diphosphate) 3'-pyrophosphohydrolase [Cryomorphaceae bacterium]MBT4813424.1 bifunctional (p)ppGpp synthetase/guanosine-3',5'-bis(diphosphate) 3'-pyrophosphohydrolase [Cryomorphaceae bacterium]MBT5417480.1 bifunctional (p)ppGpp synthetase/guanosine-3',5'-bis(diphosphate) 3'-pyrophosphohydrolase [Cryomorphaceae bact
MLVENKILPKKISDLYDDLIDNSYQKISSKGQKIIYQSLVIAYNGHDGQMRKSGEPYIYHPIEVAKIVAEDIGLDYVSIASAILHDVVEDTSITLDDLNESVGLDISRIVDGLTKISTLKKNEDYSVQAENYRKMLLTLHNDIRVILIKTADRLHNMRTIDFLSKAKQDQMASESLYIYAPLAHRVGLYNIKNELEDLSLRILETQKYNLIKNKIDKEFVNQERYVDSFKKLINNNLDDQKIKYSIIGRNKSIYSIHNKIQSKNISFDEVYDRFAIRIIYKTTPKNEKFIAWKIYSIITDHFTSNPTRLRDWITLPKTNGYEALHLTVVGPKNKWVEIQIRSERMNEIAEKGYAAHFGYKHKELKKNEVDLWLNRLQEVLNHDNEHAVDFVEDFKLNFYSKEIYVFTPNGDLKSLKSGSSALDFAFEVHTDIGIKTRGSRVNGKLVPLSHTLKSGDQVEIITSDNVKPNVNWLNFVETSKAKSKIKSSLNDEKKRISLDGKEILERKLRQLKIKLDDKVSGQMMKFFQINASNDLFYKIGNGSIDNKQIKSFANDYNSYLGYFKRKIGSNTTKIDKISESANLIKFDKLVFGKEKEMLKYSIANCCNPIPGDIVFGFVSVKEGIKVHKKDCPNSISLRSNYAYRIITANWIDSENHEFNAQIQISGIDDIGLINTITSLISNSMNVNMNRISFETNDGTFSGFISVEVKNRVILKILLKKLSSIDGIEKVSRK